MKKIKTICIFLLLICLLSSCNYSIPTNKSFEVNADTIKGKIIDVSMGNGNAFYVNENGVLFVVGRNKGYLLGLGHNEENVLSPKALKFNERITKVSSSTNFTAFLTENNNIYIFGVKPKIYPETMSGDIGTEYNKTPIKIDTSKINSKIVEIYASGLSVIILTENGDVYGYGVNKFGFIGDNTEFIENALKIDVGEKAVKIAGSSSSTWILTDKGNLYSVGDIYAGRFPDKVDTKLTKHASDVITFGCNIENVFYTNNKGEFYSRGNNYRNEAGIDNGLEYIENFTKIETVNTVKTISNGSTFFSMFIDDKDQIYIWGDNTNGWLGLSELIVYKKPFNFNYNLKAKKAIGGVGTSAIITEDGKVYVWGGNPTNQLCTVSDSELKCENKPFEITEKCFENSLS